MVVVTQFHKIVLMLWRGQQRTQVMWRVFNLLVIKSFIAPAVKKGNIQLLNWLNTEIKQLRTSGEINKIYDETLKPIYGDSVNTELFLDVGQ